MTKSAFNIFKVIVFAGLILSIPFGFQSAAAQDTPSFDQLKIMFENGLIFKAEFLHRYEDSFTGESQTSEGVIWIGKEQYKIVGSNQVMVVEGDVSRVFDETKNRLIISEYIEEEDDFAPSRMLQGVDSSYSVSERTLQNEEKEIILKSDDPFSIFEEVTILLDIDGRPAEISATDQAENRLMIRFSNGMFTEPEDGLFEIDTSQDAELIDLRYNSQ